MKRLKNLRQLWFILIVWCLSILSVQGQSIDLDSAALKIVSTAKSFGDSIILRWAPVDFKAMEHGNQVGYTIERITYASKGKRLTKEEVMESKKIFPEGVKLASAEEWERLMEINELYGIAALSVFGKDFQVNDPITSEIVSIYHQAKEKESRHNFSLFAADQSLGVAKALGLTLVDYDVSLEDEYIYTIRFAELPVNKPVMPGVVKLKTNDIIDLPPLEISDYLFGDRTIHLSWKRLPQFYNSYTLERSIDGGKTYTKINDRPIIYTPDKAADQDLILYMDTLSENNKEFHFRVRGNTIFDEVSPPSEAIFGKGQPQALTARPFIKDAVELEDGRLKIDWKFVDSLNNKITGFNIYRADKRNGEKQKLNQEMLAVNERQFFDAEPTPVNYYSVEAIDINGYSLPSAARLVQLKDHTPPVQPLGLQGELDAETGAVSLSWKPNTDADLKGYRVFFSNHKDGVYSQVTKSWLSDTSFIYQVTMNTLAEEVYFKVIATDFHDNFSEYSEVCTVKRPDTRAPNAPAILSISADEKGVQLEWASSSSADVVEHRLLRREKSAKEWQILLSYEEKISKQTFIDTLASKKSEYEYCVQALDDAGLETKSKILLAKPTDNFLRGVIVDLTAQSKERRKIIQLSWEYAELEMISEFIIYRAKKDQSISTYKIINSEELKIANSSQIEIDGKIFFDDTNVEKGQEYTYRIMAKHKDGGFSKLTDSVSATF